MTISIYTSLQSMRTQKKSISHFAHLNVPSMIDTYIGQRKKAGEKITDESYLIRNDFYNLSTVQARNAKQINLDSLSLLMDRLLVQAGLKDSKPQNRDI